MLAAGCCLFWPGQPVEVTLPAGTTASQTGALLKAKGVVASARLFRLAASLSGADRSLKPGTYKLRTRMWLPYLLDALEAGGSMGVKIVVPEGFSAKQIGERLEANGVCKADSFERYAGQNRLEGYLFPTTYFFEPGASPEAAAHRMHQEFKKRVEPEFTSASPKPELTLNQLVTLASIVEREGARAAEKPMIAAVYLNRMRIRMRLEADPTVQYALGHWKKGLSSDDLRTPSPYNTYVHYGLPPGPICNPGLDSFKAAMRPAKTEAIYFVADNTGGHVFSATLEDHIKAKQAYKHGLRIIKRRLEEERKAGEKK
ncbi:MAG: endolytic transglycosylase MltG [Elusimicrobia bacterium]|nr:endolytic transglycosylase MltG [Elusimicrobiota bacterium]